MPIRITNNRIYFNDGSYIDTANINPGDGIPSGTRMFFGQNTAPTNWTKVTDYNDMMLRVTNGTVGTRTGGLSFSSCFSSRSVTGSLSVSVNSHNVNTGSTGHNVSLQNSNITGLSFGTPTISNNTGTESVDVSYSSTSWAITPLSTDSKVVGNLVINQVSQENPSHRHSASNISYNTTAISSNFFMESPGSTGILCLSYVSWGSTQALTGVNTGTGGGNPFSESSMHEHGLDTVAPSSHYHTLNPVHSHDNSTGVFVPQHTHTNQSITGSFTDSGSHTHSLGTSTHYHNITLNHTASGTFSGNNMDFTIRYVDLILAQKD